MDSEISKSIIISFAGAILTIFSAGIIWIIKSAYEKHKAEKFALSKFERTFAINSRLLKDNFDFIKQWRLSIEQGRPYSFSLRNFSVSDEDTYKLSDLKLIKEILTLNYKLNSTNLDLDNIYKGYWDVIFRIDSIQNIEVREKNLKTYHDNFQKILEKIEQNYKPLRDSIINVVAFIREADRVRRYSLFGCLNFLFIDVFPKINKKNIEIERLILEKNLEKIEEDEN